MIAWTPGPRPPAQSPGLLTIDDVAERIGLSPRTIRFCEEEGLVAPAASTPDGHRLYSRATVDRLELIKRMKPLGLGVEEMVEVLTTLERLEDQETGAGDRAALAEKLVGYRERMETQAADLMAKAARGREVAQYLRAVEDLHR